MDVVQDIWKNGLVRPVQDTGNGLAKLDMYRHLEWFTLCTELLEWARPYPTLCTMLGMGPSQSLRCTGCVVWTRPVLLCTEHLNVLCTEHSEWTRPPLLCTLDLVDWTRPSCFVQNTWNIIVVVVSERFFKEKIIRARTLMDKLFGGLYVFCGSDVLLWDLLIGLDIGFLTGQLMSVKIKYCILFPHERKLTMHKFF